MTRRAAIYCRISQDRQGAGLGVERQRADCAALAASLGWTIVSEYIDNDLSAYSGKPRPGYRALLETLDAGRADAVLVWHTDRLHRSPRELEEYVDVCERRGVVTQTVTAGELDLSTPSGRAVARTLGAWARFESEHKSERIRRKHEQSAHAGRWRGGGRPFGWDVRPDGSATLNPVEARIVRDVAEAVLSGQSLGSVVTSLNDRQITTSTGRPWSYTSLRQVIQRPRNAGLSELRGVVVGPSTWPAILTEDMWRSVCALLADPSRRRSQSNRVRHMLAGLAVCGACGTRLKSASVETRYKSGPVLRKIYRCPARGAGHVSRVIADLDDFVTRLVLARLAGPDAAAAFTPSARRPDIEALRVEAVTLRGRMGEAADQFADGEITGAQLARINERVRARLAEVEGHLSSAATGTALAEFADGRDPAAVWERLTIEHRRSVVDALMRVVVLRTTHGNGSFDPESVRIEWRAA